MIISGHIPSAQSRTLKVMTRFSARSEFGQRGRWYKWQEYRSKKMAFGIFSYYRPFPSRDLTGELPQESPKPPGAAKPAGGSSARH